jgi:hypothetical protein
VPSSVGKYQRFNRPVSSIIGIEQLGKMEASGSCETDMKVYGVAPQERIIFRVKGKTTHSYQGICHDITAVL